MEVLSGSLIGTCIGFMNFFIPFFSRAQKVVGRSIREYQKILRYCDDMISVVEIERCQRCKSADWWVLCYSQMYGKLISAEPIKMGKEENHFFDFAVDDLALIVSSRAIGWWREKLEAKVTEKTFLVFTHKSGTPVWYMVFERPGFLYTRFLTIDFALECQG